MNREAMEKQITDYVRIMRAEKKDGQKIHEGLKKGLGISHPERISGYAGFFFSMGDVYASESVARMMTGPYFRKFVFDSLKRFGKGDFGEISDSDEMEDIENRFLSGCGRLFARYGYYLTRTGIQKGTRFYKVIRVRMYGKNTWVTFDDEIDWYVFLEEDQLKELGDYEPEEPDPGEEEPVTEGNK